MMLSETKKSRKKQAEHILDETVNKHPQHYAMSFEFVALLWMCNNNLCKSD